MFAYVDKCLSVNPSIRYKIKGKFRGKVPFYSFHTLSRIWKSLYIKDTPHCQAKQLQKVQKTTIPNIAALIFCGLLWVSWIFLGQAIAFGFQCV